MITHRSLVSALSAAVSACHGSADQSIVAATAASTASTGVASVIRIGRPYCTCSTAATALASATPPISPDHVLLGLITGASFGPPRVRPVQNAPISHDHTNDSAHSV